MKRDAENLVAWVREAAEELENAHRALDTLGVPRSLDETADPVVDMTLAARIAWLRGVRD